MKCYLSVNYHVLFFFKQKTAYEMRISDWSSDVCSSDRLAHDRHFLPRPRGENDPVGLDALVLSAPEDTFLGTMFVDQSSSEPETSRTSLPKAFLDESALSGKDLGG